MPLAAPPWSVGLVSDRLRRVNGGGWALLAQPGTAAPRTNVATVVISFGLMFLVVAYVAVAIRRRDRLERSIAEMRIEVAQLRDEVHRLRSPSTTDRRAVEDRTGDDAG